MKTNAVHTMTLVAVIAGLAAGCGTSGVGSGTLESAGKPEREGDVEFTWTADAEATRGTLQAVLPDGRMFSGNFMQITSTTVGDDLDGYWTGWNGSWDGMSDGPEFVRQYSGHVIGQLTGPDGERMRCRFQLAEPEEGPASGGMGECDLTSGETIDDATLRGERN